MCVQAATTPFFHWSPLTPIKGPRITGLPQRDLIASALSFFFVFVLLPRHVLKSHRLKLDFTCFVYVLRTEVTCFAHKKASLCVYWRNAFAIPYQVSSTGVIYSFHIRIKHATQLFSTLLFQILQ